MRDATIHPISCLQSQAESGEHTSSQNAETVILGNVGDGSGLGRAGRSGRSGGRAGSAGASTSGSSNSTASTAARGGKASRRRSLGTRSGGGGAALADLSLGSVCHTTLDGLAGGLTSKIVRVCSGAVTLPLLADEERKRAHVVGDVWGLSATGASAVVCQGSLRRMSACHLIALLLQRTYSITSVWVCLTATEHWAGVQLRAAPS